MALPEIAYPEPGWFSRFVGRHEQFKMIERIQASTDRGVVLPIIQVIGPPGVGKSWFLQRLRWKLRDSMDSPSVLLRLSNPAMAQTDRAIDALMTRLINRWRLNLRLTEFALGRIAHLQGENIDRFNTYTASLKYIPDLNTRKGEAEMRRILVERGADTLYKFWGAGWGERFLQMSPQELAWFVPDLLGLDIDSAMRSMRFKTFVLMVDDAEIVPELYNNFLRLKAHSDLTLLVIAADKPCPTNNHPVETIPLEPLPLLERRAYFYDLGIDDHRKQKKITNKLNNSSIDYAIGVVENKQLLERNPSLKKLIGTMLVCRRPSLEILFKILGDMGVISAFFAEPALVDLLEHPDRLPWRFMIHPAAREWAIERVKPLPKPEQPYGEVINRLALFAHNDFSMGLPVIYWFFRNSMAEWSIGDGVNAIFAADEVAQISGKKDFDKYSRYLLLWAMRPDFSDEYLSRFARQRVLWRVEKNEIPDLLIASKAFLDLGRTRLALWTARALLPKISARIMKSRGKNSVFMLFRSEANRVVGQALMELGEIDDAIVALSRAHEASISASIAEPALGDEAALQQIEISFVIAKCHILHNDRRAAWSALSKALDQVTGFLSGVGYKIIPVAILCKRLMTELFAHGFWSFDIPKTTRWLKRILINCERQRKESENLLAASVEVRLTPFLARILIESEKYEEAIEMLSDMEGILSILGEKMRWKAELWRKLSVIEKLLKAEVFVGLGDTSEAFAFAKQALDIIMRWELDKKPDTAKLVVGARIIGGIALARMERFKDAAMWLSIGIAAAEKALSAKEAENPVFFHSLCGDAYLEIARIEMQNHNHKKASLMAKRGIEHLQGILNISDFADIRYSIVELYMFLLETISIDRLEELTVIFESAAAILSVGCLLSKSDREQCTRFSESLFSFAVDILTKFDEKKAPRLVVNAISLYPFLKNKDLIKKAYIMVDRIKDEDLSDDLMPRFRKAKEVLDEFKPLENT